MEKVMILGAGPYQLPAIRKAKDMGFIVIACSNNPADPGMRIADIACPISTTEKEQLLTVAKREGISGIMTIGSDICVPSIAYIAENLGLPGVSSDTAMTVTDKGYFREFLNTHNFPCPKFGVAESADKACEIFNTFHGPAIMKPVLSSGSRGIVPIRTHKEIREEFPRSVAASFGRNLIVIEEFLDGREIGGEALVSEGEIVFFQLTNKYLNSHLVPKGHSLPSDLPEDTQKEVRQLISRVSKALGVTSSPLNFDIILTDTGPVIIDMGCRLGGNCLPELMTHSTGVDTVMNAIHLAIGKPPILDALHLSACYGVMILGCEHSGTLQSITSEFKMQQLFPDNIIEIKYRYHAGDEVHRFDQGANSVGSVFIKAENLAEMNAIFQQFEQNLVISVKEE